MSDVIIVAVISAATTIIATVMSYKSSNLEMNARFDKSDALHEQRMDTLGKELAELQKKVEAHNNYGLQIAKLEQRVTNLESNKG